MRVRTTTTGAFDTVNQRRQWSRSHSNAPFGLEYSSDTFSGTVKVKTIRDVEVPSFQRLRNCGEFLPLNPVTIETVTTTRKPGVVGFIKEMYENSSWFTSTYQNPGDSWWFSDWVVKPPEWDEGILSYVSNASIADAKASVWDGLTSLGEARETVGLLRTTFNRFFAFARWVARKVPSRFSKRDKLQLFSQLWLEYRYGWMPMVYDVQDIVKALETKLENGEVIRGRTRQTEKLEDTWTTSYAAGEGQVTVTQTLKGSRVYRGKAYARVTDVARARVGIDPIITGYELTRFSFIVDWFIDINSWLQAWSPFSGAELLGCCNSVKDSYTLFQTVDCTWGLHDPVPTFARTSGNFSCSTLVSVERYDRFPSGVSLPGWNPRLNKARIADLAALIFGGRSSVFRALRL